MQRNTGDCGSAIYLTPTELYLNNSSLFNVSLQLLTETGIAPNRSLTMIMSLNTRVFDDVIISLPSQMTKFSPISSNSNGSGIVDFIDCSVTKLLLLL